MGNIILTGISGMGCLSGIDQNGARWIQFRVDYFAEQVDGECSGCGAVIDAGWMCLDGGEEGCDDHVTLED